MGSITPAWSAAIIRIQRALSRGSFSRVVTFTNYDPEPAFSIVLGVNNAGDFSGSVIPSSGIQEAFVSIGGVMTDFAVTNATATLAYQINTNNTSCGYYIDSDGVTTHGRLPRCQRHHSRAD